VPRILFSLELARSAFHPKPAHPCAPPFSYLRPKRSCHPPPVLRCAARRPPRAPWRWDSSCCPIAFTPLEWALPVTPSLPLNALKPLAIEAIVGRRLTLPHPLGSLPQPIKGVVSTPSLLRIQSHLWFLSSVLHLSSHRARSSTALSHRCPIASSVPSTLRSIGEVPRDLLVP
jgi:hypothetical protein